MDKKRYIKVNAIYLMQTVAFFSFALAIPRAYFKHDNLLMAFLIVGAISLLMPFLYMVNETDKIKHESENNEDQND